ncbi:MAG TPA: thiosulfate oxidation carrier complex protein SoxZ [Burkholderiaceae bacterium]|nr:thiosulfate oxidation carrier complex protein SoxZ [Burkholderiaceae bacterium]
MTERIQLRPAEAAPGDTVEVRILVRHPQENGLRRDAQGARIGRNLIKNLVCRYLDRQVFQAELGTGIAANPLLVFELRATHSGEVAFEWEDETGGQGSASATLTVREG